MFLLIGWIMKCTLGPSLINDPLIKGKCTSTVKGVLNINKILERAEWFCWSVTTWEVLSPPQEVGSKESSSLLPGRVSGCAKHYLGYLVQAVLVVPCPYQGSSAKWPVLCAVWSVAVAMGNNKCCENLGRAVTESVLKGCAPFWSFQNIFLPLITPVSCWLSSVWTTECYFSVSFG